MKKLIILFSIALTYVCAQMPAVILSSFAATDKLLLALENGCIFEEEKELFCVKDFAKNEKFLSLDFYQDKYLLLTLKEVQGKNIRSIMLFDKDFKEEISTELSGDFSKAFLLDDGILLSSPASELIIVNKELDTMKSIRFGTTVMGAVKLDEKRERVALAFEGGNARIFDLLNWQELANLDLHKDNVQNLDFHKNSLLTCSTDRRLVLTVAKDESFREVKSTVINSDFLVYFCALDDEYLAYTCGVDNDICLLKRSSMSLLKKYDNENYYLSKIAFFKNKIFLQDFSKKIILKNIKE